ncbi:hypothetical protein HMPREF1981_00949 [Bacteroides pyogenes F0041]|uniref:Uncharacterized protein n=1 Tax=Bacteroides pyogenes F0041 TaxID=1321819 RepID=U2CQL3_9BACE|nr:hypothetical protein HMPREF1981_00949 [Bacteroides pyogenes F0041]
MNSYAKRIPCRHRTAITLGEKTRYEGWPVLFSHNGKKARQNTSCRLRIQLPKRRRKFLC